MRHGLTHAAFAVVCGLVLCLSNVASAQSTGSSSDEQVIDYINRLIRQGWTDNEISASPAATEEEWIRRLYLDMLGRIPSTEETMAFVGDRSRDKKAVLVDKLLNSDQYIEEYARNWTTLWTNVLIGRTGGTGRNTLVSRPGMQQYLRRAFLTNKPYDEIVFELISADGSNTPGEETYNGAVNFLLDNLEENAATATSKVARIFLGLQVQCTQCHNHPFNNWKQDSFWSMNAFFRQTKSQRQGRRQDNAPVTLVDQDFPGEGNDPEKAEIYYELRNGYLMVAYPTFIDGSKINPSGYVTEVNRRDELAKLVRQAPEMSQAIVNRMWGHFLGYGFTKPIDDMGPHNQPSHPELLERLGKDFAAHGHDLKQLMRWITLSEAYGLSSKFGSKNSIDDPSMGEMPLFSHFYVRQMTAEQLYESLVVATEAHKTRGSYEEQEKLKSDWLQQFSIAFGTDENDETTTFNGTIPQTLMMMNGALIKEATSAKQGSMLQRIAAEDSRPSEKINKLYLATLGRTPTRAEVNMANEAFVANGGDPLKAMQDVFWVLLNSNEFILIH